MLLSSSARGAKVTCAWRYASRSSEGSPVSKSGSVSAGSSGSGGSGSTSGSGCESSGCDGGVCFCCGCGCVRGRGDYG